MELAAGGVISLTLIVLYVLHARSVTRHRAADTTHADFLAVSYALIDMGIALRALVDKPLPDPPDLSQLALTDALVHTLNARMDNIDSGMDLLTTRVETGPGRRTIAFP